MIWAWRLESTALRDHRASCLGSTPGRQSRPPLALRTRAPHRRPSWTRRYTCRRSSDHGSWFCPASLGPILSRELSVQHDCSSALRIAASEEGVPALLGGVVSLDLINAFATNRTKANMSPPTPIPYITEAEIPAFHGIERTLPWLLFLALGCAARPASDRPLVSCLRRNVQSWRTA